jgi:hypothetical protein
MAEAFEALGLGLIAQEESKATGGVFVDAVEAFGQEVVTVLRHGDLVIVVDEFIADGHEGFALAGEGLIEEGGADAFVEAFDAEEDLLGVTIRDLCRRSSHANFRLVSQVPFGVRS